MIITKQGDHKKSKDFFFICKNCGCEWLANKQEVYISPPSLPYYVSMKCPNCRVTNEAQTYEERKQNTTNEQVKEAWEYYYDEMKKRNIKEG